MNVHIIQRRALSETTTALVSTGTHTALWACTERGLEDAIGLLAAVAEAEERRWRVVDERGQRVGVKRAA